MAGRLGVTLPGAVCSSAREVTPGSETQFGRKWELRPYVMGVSPLDGEDFLFFFGADAVYFGYLVIG